MLLPGFESSMFQGPSAPPSARPPRRAIPASWYSDLPKFTPDSSVVSEVTPSANFGERRGGRQPDMIVLHYTGMPDAEGAVMRLCKDGGEVSAHYIVMEDGGVLQCVPEALRAWHAGESAWAGETDINSCSIGVEIINRGHDWGYPAFPLRQIAAVIALCRGIIIRRDIPPERVLAHSDVAPLRKMDPGEKFPWQALANSGVGHWDWPAPITPGDSIAPGAAGDIVLDLQYRLADYGYGVPLTGRYDDDTTKVITAFQRHFRPERIDGIADPSTCATLDKLLASRAAARHERRFT
jgi:N-acetylmuramoyl-L-alanine amidase